MPRNVSIKTLTQSVKSKSALVDFRIHFIKGIIAAIGRSQIPVDTTVGKVLAITAEKRAFIDQLTTKATAVAFALPSIRDRLLHVFGSESTKVKATKLSENLTKQAPPRDTATIPFAQKHHTPSLTYSDDHEKGFAIDPPVKESDDLRGYSFIWMGWRDNAMIKGHNGKIVTIANQKGGVGKTTTAMNVGVALAREGKRVLLIDSDPQANLTSYLGVVPGEEPNERLNTLDQLYLSKRPLDAEARQLFIAKTQSGVDLIASDKALSGVEYYLFSRADRELVLSHFLNGVKAHYDFILIDTPPSLNLLTLNALCASDHVLVPLQPEFFSLEGIVKIRESVANVRDRWNSKLSIIGILLTQVAQRRKLTQEVIQTLRTEMSDLVLEAMVHENAAVTESSGHARSVIEYDRGSRGAKDYLAATKEILGRLNREADSVAPKGEQLSAVEAGL